MQRKVMVVLGLLAVGLCACNTEPVDVLKSPCVGIDNSPCGPKRDVNGWWTHTSPEAAAQHS